MSNPEDPVLVRRNVQKALALDPNFLKEVETALETLIDDDDKLRRCLKGAVTKSSRYAPLSAQHNAFAGFHTPPFFCTLIVQAKCQLWYD